MSILLILGSTGCATTPWERADQHWTEFEPGQSKEYVVGLLGKPQAVHKKEGKDAYYWRTDAFTVCRVLFSPKDNTVEEKDCRVNEEAQERARQQQDQFQQQQAMVMMPYLMQQQMQNRPAPMTLTPLTPPIKTPTNTNCTTTKTMGGVISTQCSTN